MPSLVTRQLFRIGVLTLTIAASAAASLAADRKMEARLIWGTNDDKSPNPEHKPLDAELAKKLQGLPFKWKNYFEVNRQMFTINDREYVKVEMSKQCFIEMKDKGESKVTVKLYGRDKLVNRVDRPLPKDEVLAIGGDDKNKTAWLITVRPVNGDKPKK